MITDSLASRFELYDKANPEVYEAFRKYAHEWRDAGNTRGGAGAIFEKIRWESGTRGKKEYGMPVLKLNNNYRSFMVRRLISEDKSFESFFEVRKQTSAVPQC